MPKEMTETEFYLFREYIKSIIGISLDNSKKNLLETRFTQLLKEYGNGDYTLLYKRASGHEIPGLEKKVIDAVSTNETSFFRDPKMFDMLKYHWFPEFFGNNPKRPLRIWSAACSSGQEAYSICMILKELLGVLNPAIIHLLGTDISEDEIRKANKAQYSQFQTNRGLTTTQRDHYFTKIDNVYQVKDELRALCQFRENNLFAPSHINLKFDLILCRNVLIYFTDEDKRKVLATMEKHLQPSHGSLIIGSTETMYNLTDRFTGKEYKGAYYYTTNG